MRRLLCCLSIGVLATAAPAAARITANTVAPKATLGADGKRVKAGVLLACDRVQEVSLKVTLTQGSGSSRAVGRGTKTVECATERSRFRVGVEAKKGRFKPGKGRVCVKALTDDDAPNWCVGGVKLVGR